MLESLVNEKHKVILSIILLHCKCLAKPCVVFKKDFVFFFLGSVSVVCIIPNLALRFFNFYTIAIIRLFDVITYSNNVTVYSGLPIFFVLDITKYYTYTKKYMYPKFLAG